MVDAVITVIVILLKSSWIWQNDPKKEWQSRTRRDSAAVGTARGGRGKFGPGSWQKGRGRLGSFPDKSMHHSLLLMQKRWQNEALVHVAFHSKSEDNKWRSSQTAESFRQPCRCMDTIEFYSIYSFTGLFMGLITRLTAVAGSRGGFFNWLACNEWASKGKANKSSSTMMLGKHRTS